MAPTKTAEEVRNELSRKGISVSEWARQNGFKQSAVSGVLLGKRTCRYGVSHAIAVRLGMKQGELRA